jgi:sugar phosphate isomerase/epimerase
MKIGRNFTNLLNTSFLTSERLKSLKRGRLGTADLDARVQLRAKSDIVHQIKMAAALGLDQVELDAGIPNPFLSLPSKKIAAARRLAAEKGIALSFHLPCTFVAAATASFQESDRQMAVGLLKKYIDFSARLGCVNVNMHPGCVPFYQTFGIYRSRVIKSAVRSVQELAACAERRGLVMHLENNTAFDNLANDVDECVALLAAVNRGGGKVRFCFDVGHWLSRVDMGRKIGKCPERVVDRIPKALLSGAEVHLSNYLSGVRQFHVPLHYGRGILKRANLLGLLRRFKEKGVAVLILETVVREKHEFLSAAEIMREEQEYLKALLRQV